MRRERVEAWGAEPSGMGKKGEDKDVKGVVRKGGKLKNSLSWKPREETDSVRNRIFKSSSDNKVMEKQTQKS